MDSGLILWAGVILILVIIAIWLILKEPSPKTTHVGISVGIPTPKPVDNRSTVQLNAEITGHEWGSSEKPTKL